MQFKHLFAALLCATACSSFADAQFTVSPDGTEVIDVKTGLIWRRCTEGMVASVSGCSGTASNFTHEEALTRARSQAGWRLPNVQELSSIADRSLKRPAIDSLAFPATPAIYFWSSTPVANDGQSVWVVSFNDGIVFGGDRHPTPAHFVRLVRTGQ